MKAKKKPIETIDAASLGVDLEPAYTVVEVAQLTKAPPLPVALRGPRRQPPPSRC